MSQKELTESPSPVSKDAFTQEKLRLAVELLLEGKLGTGTSSEVLALLRELQAPTQGEMEKLQIRVAILEKEIGAIRNIVAKRNNAIFEQAVNMPFGDKLG